MSDVFTFQQMEALEVLLIQAVNARWERDAHFTDADRLDALERVASDLTGLREHLTGQRACSCTDIGEERPYHCRDARRYSDDLSRVALLHKVTV